MRRWHGRILLWDGTTRSRPSITTQHREGRLSSEFTLGPVYEGPPGLVHGGVCALLLDQLLGEVATNQLSLPKFTGTITLKYLRGTPLGPLRAEAWVDRVEGHKTYARGFLADGQGPTVEAEGVFIMPAWARDETSMKFYVSLRSSRPVK